MGTRMGRIEQEFILTNIIEKKLPVRLHVRKLEMEGLFLSLDDKYLVFSSSDSCINEIHDGERVSLFFSFFSHTMTFSTKVVNEGNPLKLAMPENIYKNLKRKFIRVATGADIQLSFILKNSRIVLDFPKTKEYESLDSEVFSDNFELSGLKELYSQFNSKAVNFATNYEIIMLREKEPKTFEELIITDTGKSLLIPETSGPFPDKTQVDTEKAICEDMFLDRYGNEIQFHGKNLRQMEVLLKEKHDEGIFAELYTPVIYHEYVIAYIHLFNTSKRKQAFTDKTLNFARDFARILAYTLEKSGYFSAGEKKESVYRPEIIDISASGLLFTHDEKMLSELLGMYGDLTLTLKIGPRKMEIFSRVMRKYKNREQYFYGIQFLEMEPEDFRFLFDYVYGRPFSEEDDRLWEGGAEPPELNL